MSSLVAVSRATGGYDLHQKAFLALYDFTVVEYNLCNGGKSSRLGIEQEGNHFAIPDLSPVILREAKNDRREESASDVA